MRKWAKYFLLFMFLLYPVNSWAADWAVAWDEDVPTGAEALSSGDDRMREFKKQMRERLANDHYWLVDDLVTSDTIGFHKWVTLLEQSTDPDTKADAGRLYTKDTDSVSTLYFRPHGAGTALRLTWAVDSVDPDSCVLIVNDQTIAGAKTFTGTVTGAVSYDTAVGVSDISSSDSTQYIDMTDMTYTGTFTAGEVEVQFKAVITNSTVSPSWVRLLKDDVPVDTQTSSGDVDGGITYHLVYVGAVTAASHTFKVQWKPSIVGSTHIIYQTGTLYPRLLWIKR